MARTTVNLTDTVAVFKDKVNEISYKVGDLDLMSTSGTDSDIVQAINSLDSDIGVRSNLTTTADQNLTAAINEHDAELGVITAGAMGTTASTVSTAIKEIDSDRDRLVTYTGLPLDPTTAAQTLVGAVNEMDAELGTISSGAMGTTANNVGGAIAELEAEIDVLNTKVEPTQTLTTTATSLSDAINEHDAEIGAAALTTSATTLRGAINEHETQINGFVSDLNSIDSDLDANVVEITSRLDSAQSVVGPLGDLLTVAKNSIVGAINEVKIAGIDSDTILEIFSASNTGTGFGSLSYGNNGIYTYSKVTNANIRSAISEGEGIDISSGVISGENATTSNKGIASFNTNDFTVVNGAVSLQDITLEDVTGLATNTIVGNVLQQDSSGAIYTFQRTDTSPNDNNLVGQLKFLAEGSDNGVYEYAGVTADISESSTNQPVRKENVGRLEFHVRGIPSHGAQDATPQTFLLADGQLHTRLSSAGSGNYGCYITLGSDSAGQSRKIAVRSSTLDLTQAGTVDFTGVTTTGLPSGYVHPNHSGDVTSTGDGVTVISNDAVTYAKMQNLATANRVLGATAAGVIGETQVVRAMIGADAIDGTKIANDVINSEHYVDGSIDTAHIADDAVSRAKLKDEVSLRILDSTGGVLKTLYGAGS